MNETVVTAKDEQENPERYKALIVILTVFSTLLATLLAALQADAGIRASIANRESQYLAIRASGELHRAGLESNYEFNIFGDYLKNLQESTVLSLTSLEQENKGNQESARASREMANAAQARADVGMKFSIFYNDPRYQPKGDDIMPNAQQYAVDVNQQANDTVALQNKASDEYQKWNRKSDSYVTALTILAVAFFLFGLAQALKNARMRLTFTIFGVVVIGISTLITFLTLIG